MVQARWRDADGSTATLLLTDGDDVHLRGIFGDTVVRLNEDSDGDGAADAIVATFTQPSTYQEYGVFYDDPAIPNAGRDYDGFAIVIDRSLATNVTRYPAHRYAGAEVAFLGSAGRDKLSVDWAHAVVAGNDGDDLIATGAGDDLIRGGAGNDRIDGGRGDDVLIGGAGRDRLTGGDGADTFVFNPATIGERDCIVDFSAAGGDRIDLSAFAGLAFIGTARFSGGGPEVCVQRVGDCAALVFDLDGDRHADGVIAFLGAVAIDAGDLILSPAVAP